MLNLWYDFWDPWPGGAGVPPFYAAVVDSANFGGALSITTTGSAGLTIEAASASVEDA